jgi:hypothetical protein
MLTAVRADKRPAFENMADIVPSVPYLHSLWRHIFRWQKQTGTQEEKLADGD